MCGILGAFTIGPDPTPARTARDVARLRSMLDHRGPDASGISETDGAILAHTRLAILDPDPRANQPFTCESDRYHLIYNGELYNDHELRTELRRAGAEFRTTCDTETVLLALTTWGPDAIDRFRGMYALAFYDSYARTLLLARDPLGIKPLHYATTDRELLIASEPAPLIDATTAHEPDPVVISAYCSTIRLTLGERALYAGISTLEPGHRHIIKCARTSRPAKTWSWWDTHHASDQRTTRGIIDDSIDRHIRSDVPVGIMLSGGLDSAIIATRLSQTTTTTIRSYCAAAEHDDTDAAYAEELASQLGFEHTTIRITADEFRSEWRDTIERHHAPIGTPNEIAIRLIARRMRDDGVKVALSGEGADELFAGYTAPLRSLLEATDDPARAHIDSAAWITLAEKAAVLQPDLYNDAECDEQLLEHYRNAWRDAEAKARTTLHAHLAMQRRCNLTGLLARLDTSTMLESIEGRTPLADQSLALHARSLDNTDLLDPDADETARLGKAAIRRAFEDRVPASIRTRSKASFQLPFADWLTPLARDLMRSPAACAWFTPRARELVKADPKAAWRLTWPMCNAAQWGSRFEGLARAA